jgi:hypothetical protein
MILQRTSPRGLEFHLQWIADDTTRVRLKNKVLDVKASLNTMSQAWYLWQMKGQHIQSAFHFLRPDEREFLITGITPAEWKEMFKGAEE